MNKEDIVISLGLILCFIGLWWACADAYERQQQFTVKCERAGGVAHRTYKNIDCVPKGTFIEVK